VPALGVTYPVAGVVNLRVQVPGGPCRSQAVRRIVAMREMFLAIPDEGRLKVTLALTVRLVPQPLQYEVAPVEYALAVLHVPTATGGDGTVPKVPASFHQEQLVCAAWL